MEIFRQEHPKPQFRRDSWRNLNGTWEFEIDHANTGSQRGFADPDHPMDRTIQVPFCPESRLSGVGYPDFMQAVWYRRTLEISPEELEGTVLLHFGAVDYLAHVFVNGQECGTHRGGYVSFSLDITAFLHPGVNILTVWAEDDQRSGLQPYGKQCALYHSCGCSYTRTTGIWQTVWLEFMPKTHLIRTRFVTDPAAAAVTIAAELAGAGTFRAQAFYEGRPMGEVRAESAGGHLEVQLHLAECHLWEVGHGRLYDLELTYGEDRVHSYFGLRSLRLDGYRFLLNDRPVFQRLVLDQGFYPDGVYTAPSDEALEADIDRSLAMGFNGARLHEKVFEERFLYHCDRKGYLVWGEYPNWGLDHSRPEAAYSILPEWLEEVERDFNHPAIVGWCPFNETWDQNGRCQFPGLLRMVYLTTRAVDPTRPCIDTSGNFHEETDIFDVHNYEQDPEKFAAAYASFPVDGTFRDQFEGRQHYRPGQPMFVSEYGGIRWTDDKTGWGYGDAPASEQAFLERLQKLTDILLDNPRMMGLCYTQLTDVEQEQNGLYTYDRRPKFPPERIAPIFRRKAAIEE